MSSSVRRPVGGPVGVLLRESSGAAERVKVDELETERAGELEAMQTWQRQDVGS